ncbi:acyltransferase [Alicyclobacillus fastidiosus]|uniref:Acyltransferase n=1 Tax=Alicyclobacillus fastidiosus TaxID=392011 RepID=A0ABV5AGI9_9BACL|nr:acyltransferase [Alicyclobacillus fastidiosus]WEH08976.1 acyltransferase [Alicyclobacillus fastidiosus]
MSKRRHLYEIDLMRAFIMLGVLSVHTTSFFLSMNPKASPAFLAIGALITSMHFTRESFMFMTGLVLFITYYHRTFRTIDFWKKRFLLIAIPYIAWNVVYIVFKGLNNPGQNYWAPLTLLNDMRHSLFTGNQYYLYYVLVTIQFYVVFPLLLKGLRKFERYHLQILIGSFVVQLLLMAACKFILPNIHYTKLPPVLSNLEQYRDQIVLTYQFWFIAGGIIACHYTKVTAFIKQHHRLLLATLIFSIPIVWGHYFLDRLVFHEVEGTAETVLQPIMIPYSLLVTINLWSAGLQWAARRTQVGWRPMSWLIGCAANASFGIYLIQPFPITYMEKFIHHLDHAGIPTWLHYSLWPFCILFVYCTGMLFAHWIGKIPYLSYIVGRKMSFTKWRPNSPTLPGSPLHN